MQGDSTTHNEPSAALVTVDEIETARDRLTDEQNVHWTPVETSRSLSEAVNANVFLKMEHLQRTGSFKVRGAFNKLTQVADDDVTRAVAASAGNHAQGVALAASSADLESTIVMPRNAPQAKIDATSGYGADVVLHGTAFPAAMDHAQSLVTDDTVFVHAYDDRDIIAGQGTLGLEVLQDLPEMDAILLPIGGGGLISGVAAAIGERRPDVEIIGVQAEQAATVPQSLKKGNPQSIENPRTVADGIATGGISPLTYAHIEQYVDTVVTVTDDEISDAVLHLLERTKQMIEGAGAAPVAALRSDALDVTDQNVMVVLSGGNLSTTSLQTVLTHALTNRRQRVQLRIRIQDGPGELNTISGEIAKTDANIHSVEHQRSIGDLTVGEAFLDIEVETSGESHTERLIDSLQTRGYDVSVLS